MGDYSEAFSAIDNLPSEGLDGSKAAAGRDAPEPRKEAKDDRKEAAAAPEDKAQAKPSKRSLGDDLDGILKPKPEPKAEGSPEELADFNDPKTPKALRDAYESTRRERDELRTKYEKTRTEALEESRKEWSSKLESAERRRSELETDLRFADYTKTEDYKTKYEGPLTKAWEATMSELDGLQITDQEGVEREVVPNDMAILMRMPNPQARKVIFDMFGTAAPEVMRHRAELMRLTTERTNALNEWKQKGSERDNQIAEERAGMVRKFSEDIDSIRSEHADLFGDRSGDDEGNSMNSKGMALVKLAILGEGIPAGLTPQARRDIVLEAQTKLAIRGMGYGRAVRDLQVANSKIEELTKKLATYERTEPGIGGGRPGSKAGDGESEDESPEAAIDRIQSYR